MMISRRDPPSWNRRSILSWLPRNVISADPRCPSAQRPAEARKSNRKCSSILFEHDLFRKPLHTFRDHALDCRFMLSPDLILHGGKVITLDRGSRVAQAIAVRS